MENKNIVVFGPQGSGKGTQADILSKKFNIPHISVGELLRQNIYKNNGVGKKISKIMEQGKLIPNEITNQATKKRLSKKDCQKGFVLEGYPRNLNQANYFDKIVKSCLILEIWISDKEAVERISKRRSCPKCGAVYHLKFKVPKKDEICDKCKEKLIIRDDDKKEAIKKRLKIYHKETEPLLKRYKNKGIYRKINGTPSIAEVTKKIMEIVMR